MLKTFLIALCLFLAVTPVYGATVLLVDGTVLICGGAQWAVANTASKSFLAGAGFHADDKRAVGD